MNLSILRSPEARVCRVHLAYADTEKTFIVTGGASGLGRARAETILAAGGNVVLLDVNAETGQAAEQALGANARFAQADVSSEDQVKAAIDLAVSSFGGLHGAVNAAGIGPAAKVLGRNGPHPLDLFEKTIRVNLIGTFNVIRLAAVVIAQNQPADSGERGVIVNTASIAAFDGQIGQPAYAASKGGIVGMTLPIAREFAPAAFASSPSRLASSTRRCSPGCRSPRACRSGSKCRSRRVSAGPMNTARWCGTSSKTRC